MREPEANFVATDIGQLRQTVGHTQDEQDLGIDPNRDPMRPTFDLAEGRAADRGAFGEQGHRNSSTPPGIAKILPQLAKSPKKNRR